jgi:ubiquinone/menaquinone biosynthesis C-methylase UbiE
MNEFDEGLGTVYERLIMNGMFAALVERHNVHDVLEVPTFGMTGLTGVNSVEFVKKGCSLTLSDNSANLTKVVGLWKILDMPCKFKTVDDYSHLPFESGSFDLVWNFAALWHVADAPSLVKEMARVSSKLVWISVQNTTQPGYLLRKYVIDKELLASVHEEWLNTKLICKLLEEQGMSVIKQGVFDVPPFPDVAMPIGRKVATGWAWNIMDYYMNKDPQLIDRIHKYRIIEDSKLPNSLKALWAHHRYILARKD